MGRGARREGEGEARRRARTCHPPVRSKHPLRGLLVLAGRKRAAEEQVPAALFVVAQCSGRSTPDHQVRLGAVIEV
jgi:hypothetical protein